MHKTATTISFQFSRKCGGIRPQILFAVTALTLLIPICALAAQPPDEQKKDDLFLFPPDTPTRQVRGAILAERMNRTDLARRYLGQIIEAQLPTVELLRLRQEFGIGQFLKLSAVRELQPTSRELLRLINEATKQESPSAATVDALIAELGASEKRKLDASLRILSAEDTAVIPLLSADTATREGEIAHQLLQKYARRMRFGLLDAMPNATEAEQIRILKLLGGTSDRELAVDLQPYRFSESTAVATAAEDTCRRLTGVIQAETASQTAAQLVEKSLSLLKFAAKQFPSSGDRREFEARRKHVTNTEETVFGTASLARSATLARLAAALVPEHQEANSALLVSELAEQSWPTRWPADLNVQTAVAASVTPAETDVVAMQMALESQNAAAILAMLKRSDAAISVFNAHPDMLRECTFQTDSRVRLAAAAIRNATGKESSYSKQVLQNAIDGSRKPEAVAIDSRIGESRGMAAVLNAAGYKTVAAGSGQAGFEAATNQIHCELIVIHSNCLQWPLSMTVSNLRSDYRTKSTPIVIYGPERDRQATENTWSRYPGVWYLREPLTEITFEDAARLAGVPGPVLNEEERSQMIDFARRLISGD